MRRDDLPARGAPHRVSPNQGQGAGLPDQPHDSSCRRAIGASWYRDRIRAAEVTGAAERASERIVDTPGQAAKGEN